MVMHARKLPRLSDGYFERNQSHSYEGTNKYSKSSDRSNEKLRDTFSGVNSEGSGRNDCSDNRNSPRGHKSYSQRMKEKDHYDDSSNKSPAMKAESKNSSKDVHKGLSSTDSDGISIYQSNHDRNCSDEIERRLPPCDWSEHISSSGKKYYYNCKTEVSQWEKPKELIELEKQQLAVKAYDRSRDRIYDKQSSSIGSKNAHSQESSVSPENCDSSYTCHTESGNHKNSYLPAQHLVNSQGAQMQSHLLSPSQVTLSNLPKLISQLAGTKGLPNLSELSPQEALKTIQQALQLTKQVTNLSHNASDVNYQKSLSPAQSQNQTVTSNHLPIQNCSNSSSSVGLMNLNSTSAGSCSLSQPLPNEKVDAERASPGSDCSTHSSSNGPVMMVTDQYFLVHTGPWDQSFLSFISNAEVGKHDSPTSSVSSLHSLGTAGTSSLASAAIRPSIPSLTPSLANYYREDLISHVMGWQADHAERQANRYWEDGHNIGSLNCTQVSAELKMARALVRLAEIQATLQEQRILFLRQQTKELDDWRSLNSFMSDS